MPNRWSFWAVIDALPNAKLNAKSKNFIWNTDELFSDVKH